MGAPSRAEKRGLELAGALLLGKVRQVRNTAVGKLRRHDELVPDRDARVERENGLSAALLSQHVGAVPVERRHRGHLAALNSVIAWGESALFEGAAHKGEGVLVDGLRAGRVAEELSVDAETTITALRQEAKKRDDRGRHALVGGDRGVVAGARIAHGVGAARKSERLGSGEGHKGDEKKSKALHCFFFSSCVS